MANVLDGFGDEEGLKCFLFSIDVQVVGIKNNVF